jgi:hypothetical protein
MTGVIFEAWVCPLTDETLSRLQFSAAAALCLIDHPESDLDKRAAAMSRFAYN